MGQWISYKECAKWRESLSMIAPSGISVGITTAHVKQQL